MLSVAEGGVARLAHRSPAAPPAENGPEILAPPRSEAACAPARPVLMGSLRVNYS